MTTTGAARLLRNPEAPKRATLLELLFDVAYVAALAVLSMRLAGSDTWVEVGRVLVLLMAVWWTWSVTTVLTDFYDPEQPLIQIVVITAMTGAIVMTAVLTTAFAGRGLVFAAAYVMIHFVRGALLLTGLRGHRRARTRATRFLFWFALSGVFWIVGGVSTIPARGALWAVALAIDYLGAGLRYPTPWLGRVPLEQYDKASAHLGERYQQFVILALGDLVLVPTLRISSLGFAGLRVVAYLGSFASALLLWQVYVFRAGAFSETAIERRPGRATRSAAYTHFLIVAGTVATAAAYERIIIRPTGATPTALASLILSGPALVLLGRVAFGYQVFGVLAWYRLGWLAVLILVTPAMVLLPPILVAAAAVAVLLGISVTDVLLFDKPPPWRRARGSERK